MNTLVGAAIRPRPQVGRSPRLSARRRAPTLPATLDVDGLYRLIGQKPPRAPDRGRGAGRSRRRRRTATTPRAPPAKSDLPLQLVAGVIAERPRVLPRDHRRPRHPRDARARRRRRARRRGACSGSSGSATTATPPATASSVVAIVCNDGHEGVPRLRAGGGERRAVGRATSASPPVAAPGAPRPPRRARWRASAQVADNRYEIDREVIDCDPLRPQHRSPPRPASSRRFKNGVANGFKLFSIQPGSLYSVHRHRERRRDPARERVRDQLAREGARALPEAARVAARHHRARARRPDRSARSTTSPAREPGRRLHHANAPRHARPRPRARRSRRRRSPPPTASPAARRRPPRGSRCAPRPGVAPAPASRPSPPPARRPPPRPRRRPARPPRAGPRAGRGAAAPRRGAPAASRCGRRLEVRPAAGPLHADLQQGGHRRRPRAGEPLDLPELRLHGGRRAREDHAALEDAGHRRRGVRGVPRRAQLEQHRRLRDRQVLQAHPHRRLEEEPDPHLHRRRTRHARATSSPSRR